MPDFPSQVVSICGLSAVGKGTLIDRLASPNETWRSRFGITGETHFFAKRRAKTRSGKTDYRPLEAMYTPPHPETIVFRWQFKDHDELFKLHDHFPDVHHRAIVV